MRCVVMKERSPFLVKPIARAIAGRVEGMFLNENLKNNFSMLEGQLASSPDGEEYLCGKDITGADILMSKSSRPDLFHTKCGRRLGRELEGLLRTAHANFLRQAFHSSWQRAKSPNRRIRSSEPISNAWRRTQRTRGVSRRWRSKQGSHSSLCSEVLSRPPLFHGRVLRPQSRLVSSVYWCAVETDCPSHYTDLDSRSRVRRLLPQGTSGFAVKISSNRVVDTSSDLTPVPKPGMVPGNGSLYLPE